MGALQTYRGRIAPSPTGYLHLGHASTFWTAFERAREQRGTLVFRNEDLDPQRCRAEFARAMIEDLRWYGIEWQEGQDVGGEFGPYAQSERRELYRDAWRRLRDGGLTVLVIEHDMHVVEGISDRVVALDHGIKIAEGEPARVVEDPAVQEAYFGR